MSTCWRLLYFPSLFVWGLFVGAPVIIGSSVTNSFCWICMGHGLIDTEMTLRKAASPIDYIENKAGIF